MRLTTSPTHRVALLILLIIGGTVGCVSPMTTRYPQVCGGNPRVERRAYQRNDPLPDRHFGPDTFTRPRGFERQRTEERQSAEQQPVPNMLVPGGGYPAYPTYPTGPQIPSGAMRYPEAVIY